MAATYRANVTDKQQVDLENALNDSAIRIQSFDGKEEQVGKTKFMKVSGKTHGASDSERF